MFKAQTIVEFIENAVETSRSGRYLFFLNLRPVLGPICDIKIRAARSHKQPAPAAAASGLPECDALLLRVACRLVAGFEYYIDLLQL
ncbi:Suppressor of Cytokine signaling 7 [Operophtera brumata]|uniref:Suppressor of Cytokine signaling 7 n=1 Tax=Operophtera brumata TaxID=104452 RepID=A0A0L7LV60_OPEBR|nr:Suppressor of Cytokine signaling 7 [Operophtera brumata]